MEVDDKGVYKNGKNRIAINFNFLVFLFPSHINSHFFSSPSFTYCMARIYEKVSEMKMIADYQLCLRIIHMKEKGQSL